MKTIEIVDYNLNKWQFHKNKDEIFKEILNDLNSLNEEEIIEFKKIFKEKFKIVLRKNKLNKLIGKNNLNK